jgi:hypothetical protein
MNSVYVLFEGYYCDDICNTHFGFVECFDSLEKALQEVRNRDNKWHEYHFYESRDAWHFENHNAVNGYYWPIYDSWKIIKTTIK